MHRHLLLQPNVEWSNLGIASHVIFVLETTYLVGGIVELLILRIDGEAFGCEFMSLVMQCYTRWYLQHGRSKLLTPHQNPHFPPD